jgi:hypothetical protein
MTSAPLRAFTLAITIAMAVPSPGQAQGPATALSPAAMFEQPLAPHGEWIEVPPYGLVWRPVGIEAGWRPYFHGEWVWTDEGWYWASDEPWGWATYHYGRWLLDPRWGWCWVPGDVWAPAWVAWRLGAGAVGWAPLAPGVTAWWVETVPIVPGLWVFVPARTFVGVRIERAGVFPPGSVPQLLHESRPAPPRQATPSPVSGHRPAPAPPRGGPSRRFIEDHQGKPVPPRRIVAAPSAAEARGVSRDGAVRVYRPAPARPVHRAPAAAPRPAPAPAAPRPAPDRR